MPEGAQCSGPIPGERELGGLGCWILRSATSLGSLGDAFSLTEPPLAQLENGDKIRLGLRGPFRDCNVIPYVWFVAWSLPGVSHHELAHSDYY